MPSVSIPPAGKPSALVVGIRNLKLNPVILYN